MYSASLHSDDRLNGRITHYGHAPSRTQSFYPTPATRITSPGTARRMQAIDKAGTGNLIICAHLPHVVPRR